MIAITAWRATAFGLEKPETQRTALFLNGRDKMASAQQASPESALSIWVPLPHSFRQAVQHATETAFVGRKMLTTVSGETVMLDDVLRYNQKAEGPLVSTFQKLNSIGRADTVRLIQRLYPLLVPYFIGCGTANPVHHTAYVMEFMATILIGETKTAHSDVDVEMLAALFHDMAQGCSELPKITEQHIKDKIQDLIEGKCTLDDLENYRKDAVKARKEHMEKGAEKAGDILRRNTQGLSDVDIRQVQEIVKHHDDPKIPIIYNLIRKAFANDEACKSWASQLSSEDNTHLQSICREKGEQYLLRIDDWRLQDLHEADLLWMVTQDGIEADLARFSPAKEKTWRGMIDNNIKQHQTESELYRNLQNFSAYGFQDDTAYRTKTGYALFKHLTTILCERYP